MSLGLVSYDDSEGSENEAETDYLQEKVITKQHGNETPAPATTSKVTSSNESFIYNESQHKDIEESQNRDVGDKTAKLAIPESKLSLLNTDIDIKYLTSANKRSGTVKIIIPSLNEVDEEEDKPLKKKLKPSQKGSGLFALLPNPKSTLVPQSVVRPNNKHKATNIKPTPATVKNIKAPSKPQVVNKQSLISYEDSGDEDESTESVDFFSLASKDDIISAPVDVDIHFPQDSQTQSNSPSKDQSNEVLTFNQNFQNPSWPSPSNFVHSSSSHNSGDQYTTSDFVTFNNEDLKLDEEAMQQLCGKRDRLKMQAQNVSVIDVSGDAIMPDRRDWLTKQLTEETSHRPSHKRKDGPTSQQKRKHQITYLAFQAKENELELKNQWASNRMSRKQTQAKYGF